MTKVLAAKIRDKWYTRTSFDNFKLQVTEYKGTSSNGFYEINSLSFIDKDNNILPIKDLKEVSINEATFTLNNNITGTVTYDGDFNGNSNGIGKILSTSGWFYPTKLNLKDIKPVIEFSFSNIIPRLSKITWRSYNAGSSISKLNFISNGLEITDREITTQELIFDKAGLDLAQVYKNRQLL